MVMWFGARSFSGLLGLSPPFLPFALDYLIIMRQLINPSRYDNKLIMGNLITQSEFEKVRSPCVVGVCHQIGTPTSLTIILIPSVFR